MTRQDFLEKTLDILDDRDSTHGSAEDNFSLCAQLWNETFGTSFSMEDVAIALMLLKVSRIYSSEKPHEDNYIDICGYAALAGEMATSSWGDKKGEYVTFDSVGGDVQIECNPDGTLESYLPRDVAFREAQRYALDKYSDILNDQSVSMRTRFIGDLSAYLDNISRNVESDVGCISTDSVKLWVDRYFAVVFDIDKEE